jgi:hypothetical protein
LRCAAVASFAACCAVMSHSRSEARSCLDFWRSAWLGKRGYVAQTSQGVMLHWNAHTQRRPMHACGGCVSARKTCFPTLVVCVGMHLNKPKAPAGPRAATRAATPPCRAACAGPPPWSPGAAPAWWAATPRPAVFRDKNQSSEIAAEIPLRFYSFHVSTFIGMIPPPHAMPSIGSSPGTPVENSPCERARRASWSRAGRLCQAPATIARAADVWHPHSKSHGRVNCSDHLPHVVLHALHVSADLHRLRRRRTEQQLLRLPAFRHDRWAQQAKRHAANVRLLRRCA